MIGALLSGAAGFIGMNISVRANVRTAEAARTSLQGGLTVAFRAGAITGMLVAGLALLAISVFFYVLVGVQRPRAQFAATVVDALVALAFGASLISIFARLGGGIFTKAADVGADLVGKVEAGIPEDDPRNPAVIADNVGDNVGDCAGMAADLFETYVVTVGATMVLIALLVTAPPAQMLQLMSLPLLIGGVCIITSIIGTYFVRLGAQAVDHGRALQGLPGRPRSSRSRPSTAAMWYVLAAIWTRRSAAAPASTSTCRPRPRPPAPASPAWTCSGARWSASASPALIVWITEYYTGTNYRPVQSIARASQTGHGTNVIQGLAISLESTALPTLVICVGIIVVLPARRPDRHRLRGDRDAGAGRHGRRARRLRPGHRQCRRHRRNGGAGRTTSAPAPTRSTRSATPPRR